MWVLFSDPEIGENCRFNYRYLHCNAIDLAWTPILEVTRHFNISNRSQIEILRRQFPFRAAAAKTIHRSQGDTVNKLVIDFPKNTREHMHYVALSRVTSLRNLQIRNFNEHKIGACNKVKLEMARLREQSRLKLSFKPIYEINRESNITIVFQNVRSLHLHIKDVASDYNIMASDVINIAETSLDENDSNQSYNLNNFNLFRNDHSSLNSERIPYGLAVYVRQNIFLRFIR